MKEEIEIPFALVGTLSSEAIAVSTCLIAGLDEFKELKKFMPRDKMNRALQEIRGSRWSYLLAAIGWTDELEEKYQSIKKLTISGGGRRCDWCSSPRHVLHEHHFPIPKRMGGNKLVSICGACHADFHQLERWGARGMALILK